MLFQLESTFCTFSHSISIFAKKMSSVHSRPKELSTITRSCEIFLFRILSDTVKNPSTGFFLEKKQEVCLVIQHASCQSILSTFEDTFPLTLRHMKAHQRQDLPFQLKIDANFLHPEIHKNRPSNPVNIC